MHMATGNAHHWPGARHVLGDLERGIGHLAIREGRRVIRSQAEIGRRDVLRYYRVRHTPVEKNVAAAGACQAFVELPSHAITGCGAVAISVCGTLFP